MRNRALDGLRAVAVVGVLLFHAGHLASGFLGVDLFFVLSGFLITRLLLDEVERAGRIDLARFWTRRGKRLFPALGLMLVAVVVWSNASANADQLDQVRHMWVPSIAYVSNWAEISSNGYWALFRAPSPLTHLWSLAIEEQFYVVWPLVFVLAARARRTRVAVGAVCGVAVAVSIGLLWMFADQTERAYLGTDTRMGALAFGALIACALPWLERVLAAVGRRLALEASGVALVALVWIVTDAPSPTLFKVWLPLHWLGVALLITAFVVGDEHPRALPRRMMSHQWLVWVGERSYGWYLWHWPMQLALWPGNHSWAAFATRAVVSLGFAAVSYHFVEQPVRRAPSRPSAVLVASLAGAALLISALLVIPHPDLSIAAFDPGSVDLPTTTLPSASTTPGSTTTTTLPALAGRGFDRLVWGGDSIAFTTSGAMEAAVTAAGWRYSVAAGPGKGVVGADGKFDHWQIDVLTPILDSHTLVAFQTSLWDGPDGPEARHAAYMELIRFVRSTGADILFVVEPPTSTDRTPDAATVRNEVAGAPGGPVVVLDPTGMFRGVSLRDPDGDGVPDRRLDGVHMCPQGAAKEAAWLVQQLAGLGAGLRPAPVADWATGPWTTDPGFSDPPGTCL